MPDYNDKPIPPIWFEEANKIGVYKKVNSLGDWLFALDPRFKLKSDINRKIKLSKLEGDSLNINLLNEERAIFFNIILQKEQNRVAISDPLNNLRNPVSDQKGYLYPDDTENDLIRLRTIGIDFSYDKKTLMDSFEEFIDRHRTKLNQKYIDKDKFLTNGDKGLKKYSNSTSMNWSDRKVLQCIDFNLYNMCSGERKFRPKEIASILNITVDKYNSANSTGKFLMTILGLSRLRASDYLLSKKQ